MKQHFIRVITVLAVAACTTGAKAQEKDLLDLVDDGKTPNTIVTNAFKSIRIINGHSMEFLAPGTMDFRILHRFGQMNQGTKNLFGLDQASMRLGLDFGITRKLQLGVGRSTFKKELDGYIKYAPIRQSTGDHAFPMTIALVGGAIPCRLQIPPEPTIFLRGWPIMYRPLSAENSATVYRCN